jgi:predicted double-glycine peptidase
MLELAVPSVVQETGWSCGPASLLSCLKYLGVAGDLTEDSLASEIRTTEQGGTSAGWMVAGARKWWPRTEFIEGLTYEELCDRVRQGDLCILLLQAWASEETLARVPYEDNLADGHYVVATAVGPRSAYFADPSLARVRARLTRRELERRWHEQEDLIVVRKAAIVLTGQAPRTRPLGRTRVMG